MLVLSRTGTLPDRVYDPVMDWIVCGDALWISCGTWVAIWNGAIGAFVAAVLGAFVALGVVIMSNRHQSHLGDLARTEARTEAEKAREITAIAELISFTAWMSWSYRADSFDSGDAYQKLEAARVRLQMASPSCAPLAEAMKGWSSLLTSLAIAEASAEQCKHQMQVEIHETLGRGLAAVSGCLPDWPHEDDFHRTASLIILRDHKAKMTSMQDAAVDSGLFSGKTTMAKADAVADM